MINSNENVLNFVWITKIFQNLDIYFKWKKRPLLGVVNQFYFFDWGMGNNTHYWGLSDFSGSPKPNSIEEGPRGRAPLEWSEVSLHEYSIYHCFFPFRRHLCLQSQYKNKGISVSQKRKYEGKM